MSANENTNGEGSPLFLSRFDNKVDEKRRIQVPSSWRRGQTGLRYVLLPVPKLAWRPGCLLAMPPVRFTELMQRLETMKFSDDRADSLRRLLATRACEVETDTAGRLCLPEEMTKATGIQDRVVLAGVYRGFEIWSPERYAEVESLDDARSGEAFGLI